VPNYNHAAFLHQRLDCIYKQSYRNIEVLLLDDCSTDGSRAILEDYADCFPSITRTHYNHINSGCVFRQWRKGLSLARGELVWIAESDDYCDLNFLETLVKAFDDEAVQLAYSRQVFVNEDGTTQNGSFEDYVGVVDRRKWVQCYVNTAHAEVHQALGARNTIPNVSGTLFRKPQSLALLDDPEWLEMRVAGDWVFYLHLLRGGKIAFSLNTNSYFRFHSKNTSVATYTRDVYYREHGIAAYYTALLYDVPEAVLRKNFEITRDFYREFVADGNDKAFDALFRSDRVERARKHRLPNILVSSLAFIPGGAEVTPILVANELKRRGVSVLFHSCDYNPDNERIRRMLRADVPVVRAQTAAELKKIIAQFRIEVVNSHHHASQRLPLEDPDVFAGVRHIGTLHGVYENIEMESPEVIDTELAVIDGSVDAWTYVAKKNLIPFRKRGLYSPNRFFWVPNGTEPGKIEPKCRDDIGLPEDAFVLCIVSRAVPEKGWLEGVEIIQRARALSARDIHLILVGDGPVYDQMVRDGVDPFIHPVGFHDHPIDFFATADMGFLPSRYRGESMPNSLIECFFAGRPAIASDLGEIRNMLSIDGEIAGAIIPLQNWELDIAAAAEQVSQFAEDVQRYRRAADLIPRVAERFRIDTVVDSYLDVFTGCLPGSNGEC
jgi:glycosyltransferase involved in cell wall biosynthesis